MSIRSRGFAAFLFVVFSIIALSNPSTAGEQQLFDKVLTINKWHVHASQHSFNAADECEAQIEVIKNNTGSKARRGFFILNGRPTFIGDFLSGDEQVFKKAVSVKAANRLFVFLLGIKNILPPAGIIQRSRSFIKAF